MTYRHKIQLAWLDVLKTGSLDICPQVINNCISSRTGKTITELSKMPLQGQA